MSEPKFLVLNDYSKANERYRFPKLTNDTIKGTLGEHFAYVGANKADKKWVYVASS